MSYESYELLAAVETKDDELPSHAKNVFPYRYL